MGGIVKAKQVSAFTALYNSYYTLAGTFSHI